MKKSVIIAGLAMSWLTAAAQTDSGGISLKDIEGFRASFAATPGTKALHNAIANNPINSLGLIRILTISTLIFHTGFRAKASPISDHPAAAGFSPV